jgi:elongation factor Ts
MAQANIDLLKKLRNESSASIADCRVALEENDNNYDKAVEWLKKRGLEKAEKKSERETHQGLVESYIHNGGKVGSLIVLLCETDFVARTDEFKNLAREIGMQVAAMNPESIEVLLKQEYIRDSSHTMESLIKSIIGKLGENITLREFKRFEI